MSNLEKQIRLKNLLESLNGSKSQADLKKESQTLIDIFKQTRQKMIHDQQSNLHSVTSIQGKKLLNLRKALQNHQKHRDNIKVVKTNAEPVSTHDQTVDSNSDSSSSETLIDTSTSSSFDNIKRWLHETNSNESQSKGRPSEYTHVNSPDSGVSSKSGQLSMLTQDSNQILLLIKQLTAKYNMLESFFINSFEQLIALFDNFYFLSSLIGFNTSNSNSKITRLLRNFIKQASKIWLVIIFLTVKNLFIRMIKLNRTEKKVKLERDILMSRSPNSSIQYEYDAMLLTIRTSKISTFLEMLGNVNEFAFYLIQVMNWKVSKKVKNILAGISWIMSIYRMSKDEIQETNPSINNGLKSSDDIIDEYA